LPDRQIPHPRHAQTARRANLPHACALASSGKSQPSSRASRLDERGVRVVTKRRGGMRWTRARRQTTAARADGQAVWSRRSEAGAKFAETIRGRRWQPSHGHRGEHGAAVKTIAQGRPGIWLTCGAAACFFCCTRTMGISRCPVFPAPSHCQRVSSSQGSDASGAARLRGLGYLTSDTTGKLLAAHPPLR
jgi:hypothetical protein